MGYADINAQFLNRINFFNHLTISYIVCDGHPQQCTEILH